MSQKNSLAPAAEEPGRYQTPAIFARIEALAYWLAAVFGGRA